MIAMATLSGYSPRNVLKAGRRAGIARKLGNPLWPPDEFFLVARNL